MARGIKRIKWNGQGKVFSNLSTPNKKIVIAPDQEVYFTVDLWYPDSTSEDRKKNVTWILQDRKKSTVIVQKTHSPTAPQRISIPSALCGPFEYYVEASITGERDLINTRGLFVSGHCPSKITSYKWCKTNDGEDVGKEHLFKYGETIYLNLMTEGVNGHRNLSIDVFQKGGDEKKPLHRYTSIDVIDGEINLAIKNTYTWYSNLKSVKENEEFYVKVFDPANNLYILNNENKTIQARYLKINKKIISKEVKPPTNQSPLKTGEPQKSKERNELCRFEMITITESKKTPVRIFDNGENLKGEFNPKMYHLKTILFDFDKHDITPEAKTIINNVLQYLLTAQHSYIKIDGHACVIGKEQYNQKLSQHRSDAVKKIFVDGGLDTNRIVSVGKGEVNPTDDKKGRDNLKYKDEKEYIENRRVDIMFESFGHDAQTIIYETTAPNYDQNAIIDITEYQNTACFQTSKHKKNIKINSTEYPKALTEPSDKLVFPIKSNLSRFSLYPLEFIWPKVFPNEYDIDVHSCRYFSNEKNKTAKIRVYPDIKWNFHFFLNLSNDTSAMWQNLPPGQDAKMRKIAGKIGAQKRWKQTDIDFGVVLKADWNKVGADEYKNHFDATYKYEAKIKQLYSLFSSLRDFSDYLTKGTAGVAKKTARPLTVEMKPPNFCLGAIWQLERGSIDNKPTNELGMNYAFYFKAEPLLALVLTIDLLDIAVQTVSTIATGGAGNEAVHIIFNIIREWAAKDRDLGITFKVICELKITGQVDGIADLTYNTASNDKTKAKGELKTKLSGEIKLEVELKAKAVILEVTVYAAGIASASGKIQINFNHSLIYNKSPRSLNYIPKLNVDGVTAKFLVKIEAGISAKKTFFELNTKDEIVIVEKDLPLWDGFDILKKVEEITGYETKIQFL